MMQSARYCKRAMPTRTRWTLTGRAPRGPTKCKSRTHVAATCVVARWLTECRPNRAEATRVAAIEALFASVNPTVAPGPNLQEALTKAMDAVASMPNRSAGVRRALYPSMARTFDRLPKAAGEVPRFDVRSLKQLLFGEAVEVEVEAVRLLRAEAIVAVTRAAGWLAEEVKSEVAAVKRGERSAAVQKRLPGGGV